MNLHASNSNSLAGGKHFEFFFLADRPGDERAGHDRAEAFHGENAIDGKASQRGRVFRRNLGGYLGERGFQLVQTRARQRAHSDDRRFCSIQKRSAHKVFDFQPHHVERLRIHRVGFCEHGDAAADRKQAADIEMFASLRLDPFIGGDYEQHQVDAADACKHVAHKALVAGDIDKTQANFAAIGGGEFEVGEADVDGDATPFFFFEAIGVNAGQGFDEGCFAVIDMSGGADDDGFHLRQYRRMSVLTIEDSRSRRSQDQVQRQRQRARAPALHKSGTNSHAKNWWRCDNKDSLMTTSAISVTAITPEMIREHGLTAEEFEKIKQLLGGREPTRTELSIFSVMWSEHCSYKSSRVHLKRL